MQDPITGVDYVAADNAPMLDPNGGYYTPPPPPTQAEIDAANAPYQAAAFAWIKNNGGIPFLIQSGDALYGPGGTPLHPGWLFYNAGNGVGAWVPGNGVPDNPAFIAAPQHNDGFFQADAYNPFVLLSEMPGLIVPLVALTAGAASAWVGAASAGTGTVGVDASTGLFAGESANAGVLTYGAADTAAITAGATSGVDASTGLFAGESSNAGVLTYDATGAVLAPESTVVPETTATGDWWTEVSDAYKAAKPYVDAAKTAYGGYKALTTQQKVSNTPARRYAPMAQPDLVPVTGLGDSSVMPAALLLLAVFAKARKSR